MEMFIGKYMENFSEEDREKVFGDNAIHLFIEIVGLKPNKLNFHCHAFKGVAIVNTTEGTKSQNNFYGDVYWKYMENFSEEDREKVFGDNAIHLFIEIVGLKPNKLNFHCHAFKGVAIVNITQGALAQNIFYGPTIKR